MSESQRWYCKECHREWVEPKDCYMNSAPISITGNPLKGPNCQYCGSPEIQLIQFKPKFPGLDIPRDGSITVIPAEVLHTVPGHNTSQNYSIRSESKDSKIIPFEQITQEEIIYEMEKRFEDWTQII